MKWMSWTLAWTLILPLIATGSVWRADDFSRDRLRDAIHVLKLEHLSHVRMEDLKTATLGLIFMFWQIMRRLLATTFPKPNPSFGCSWFQKIVLWSLENFPSNTTIVLVGSTRMAI